MPPAFRLLVQQGLSDRIKGCAGFSAPRAVAPQQRLFFVLHGRKPGAALAWRPSAGRPPCSSTHARACDSVKNVRGAWIKEQKVSVEDGRITSYRVNMQVTFVVGDGK